MKNSMKTWKLCIHTQLTYKNQDILLSPKEFPDLKAGDVVELYHPEDDSNRILLQVKSLPEEYQQKDAVSVDQTIASAFSFRPYANVIINKVDPKNVALDLVEMLFKEQYLARGDMWRLCKTMTNTCVYMKKTVEFAEMRASVNELWAGGEKVTCGIITDDTRIVFRSPTAVVQIFIQMSSEMWDFDLHGDLYFEKAVNGFLTDLFDKWKEQNCLHDVTIVLFSRTYYDAQSKDEFPPSMKECLLPDANGGRFYEDFYRVIVQNERYEEWSSVLRQLRELFNVYQETVVHYHSHAHPGWRMPRATNSVASQGNVLETLNMSLNLFEKYYADRNFDRTGKVSVVITPGPGVFEVDRQLANITKQRTIDCGIGSDLVCMGEQPLHAAPLFKFHSKTSHKSIEVGDDYNIPHWMNHSFYMSKNQIEDHMNSSFVPRIKPPPGLLKELEEGPKLEKKTLLHKNDAHEDNIPFVDYDEYDAQVFKLPSGTLPRAFSKTESAMKTSFTFSSRSSTMAKTWSEARQRLQPRTRHISDELSAYMNDHKETKKDMSAAISIPNNGSTSEDMSFSFGCYPIRERALSKDSFESSESDELASRPVVGSAGSPVGHSRGLYGFRPHRALINPFAPSRLQFKMTSNRRRWVHAFPVDQKGMQIQARHVHSVSHTDHDDDFPWSNRENIQSPQVMTVTMKSKKPFFSNSSSGFFDNSENQSQGSDSISVSPVSRYDHIYQASRRQSSDTGPGLNFSRQGSSSQIYQGKKLKIFGTSKSGTGHEWSPDMNTGYDWRPLVPEVDEEAVPMSRLTKSSYSGDIQSNLFTSGIPVDWKSLTIPASLPVTTDYCPDRRSLTYDYVVSEYELLPEAEDVNAEIWASWSRSPSIEDKTLLAYRRAPLNTHEVFLELISQRLGQGFQLITKKKSVLSEMAKISLPSHSSGSGLAPGFMRHNSKAFDEEYYMSIGRIYHKVTLSGQTVKVTRYWPRHQQPTLCLPYKYRFQAPDSYSYDVSWTNFANERLENYNWNHLDQYICTGGDLSTEYGLIDSLRYWRSRFLLLPLSNCATKKIMDKETTRCDIYEEKSMQDLNQLVVGFVKFLESMNKLKRPSTQQRKAANTASVNSGDVSPRKQNGEGGKEKEERLNITSPLSKIAEALADPVHGLNMIQQQTGLPANTFISAEAVTWCTQNVAGVDNISKAVSLLQKLMDENLILHGSGNSRHKFIYGFYLYYIPSRVLNKTSQELTSSHPTSHLNTPGSNYNSLFQNEWCEVAVLPGKQFKDESLNNEVIIEDHTKVPQAEHYQRKPSDSMLNPNTEDWRDLTGQSKQSWNRQTATLLHKYANVDVDPQRKSDRKEFAMARYHAYYSPTCAFELQLHWMVATGTILGDLVYGFARRASSCGFHLMPVPCDPFALPYTENSDPLRGPIFVPLNMTAFDPHLFDNCSNEKRQEILYTIQDAIIKRFGFMPVSVKVPGEAQVSHQGENYNHQYVHCTAGMFVLIPESNPVNQANPFAPGSLHPLAVCLSSSPQHPGEVMGLPKKSPDLHKFYIARQGRPESAPNEVGFLWSWNYMSSKRWRTSNTGDEKFQDAMLADFRKFCSNEDQRLREFWNQFEPKLDK